MENSQIVLSGKVKDSGDSARVCTKACTNWFMLTVSLGKKQEYVDRNQKGKETSTAGITKGM